ncbi:response regulator [Candidatus Woesebacteria bacterium]|nr:response regulator [Candidatus Woesebacteria bacterium]
MSKKILLIEDDEFLHELYHDLLTAESYEVEGAKDGKTAYEKMKENTWDLVLLDVMLPVMSGFEIMDQLAKENIHLTCPIVFLTNLDSTATDLVNLKKATEHWTKSDMSPPEFVTKVKSLI